MKYVYLSGKLIAEVNAGASVITSFLHTDGLGSPVARTGSNGALIDRTRYEPYGATAAGTNSGTGADNIGFTGHANDPVTGLIYMQQRYYDPVAGRFLSTDPVTTDANTGSSFGRYHYANNNPYRYVDPDGRQVDRFDDSIKFTRYDEDSNRARNHYPIISFDSSSASSSSASGWLHGRLSFASFCPSICESIFGGIDGLLSLAEGDNVGAGISFAAAGVGLFANTGLIKLAANFSRELKAADLGIKGTVQELRGTFAVKDGIATIRVDMIRGEVQNPLGIVGNMTQAARASGATSLRIEGALGNERLYNVLQKRYGLTSSGAVDAITVPLK